MAALPDSKRVDSDRQLVEVPLRASPVATILSGFLVFLLAFGVLFFTMPRLAGVYDEGLVLTNAMRVGAGQIPHRDFYAYYGPAQFYLLAGLFKVFGLSLLVARLFDLTLKSLLICSIFYLVRNYFGRAIALTSCALGILWLIQTDNAENPVVGVSLINLWALTAILPAFARTLSRWRLFFAGALAGGCFFFRYDTGIALCGVIVGLLAIAAWFDAADAKAWLVRTTADVWPCLAVFAAVVLPPALLYLGHASASDFVADSISYPAKNYHRARNLPLPSLRYQKIDAERDYLPLVVLMVALIALYTAWRWLPQLKGVEQRAWRGFLISFSFLSAVMYLKGLVRFSPGHFYLSTISGLFVLSALMAGHQWFGPRLRMGVTVLLCCYGLGAIAPFSQPKLRDSVTSLSRHLLDRARGRTTAQDKAWCAEVNPLTRGVCFDTDQDRMQAIEFLRSHTAPGQELLSALSRNDVAFANDNVIYFASDRLPATHWADFNPLVQNTLPVQTQMVDELQRKGLPYIVAESGFLSQEPNDSSKSTGVFLLDQYIQSNYRTAATYGNIDILNRQR
jgi:Dolichyl-phosphate-mannose-protein mannosyltransferase